MNDILIKNYIEGNIAVSYEDGKKCQRDILEKLEKNGKVSLDFDGIEHVITAFLNPVIGDLILEFGNDVMKQIEIKNVNSSILNKIKLVKEGALVKREDLEE